MTKEAKEEKSSATKSEQSKTVDKTKPISKSKSDEKSDKPSSSAKKEPNSDKKGQSSSNHESVNVKYNKLKKKHRYLRDEYSKILESWELATKQLKILLEERKQDLCDLSCYRFYKKKLESFLKSQNFIDEQIFKQNEVKSTSGNTFETTKVDPKSNIPQVVQNKLPNGTSSMAQVQQQQNKPITMPQQNQQLQQQQQQPVKKPITMPPSTSQYASSVTSAQMQQQNNQQQQQSSSKYTSNAFIGQQMPPQQQSSYPPSSAMYSHSASSIGSSVYQQNQGPYSTTSSMINRNTGQVPQQNGLGGATTLPGGSPYTPNAMGGYNYNPVPPGQVSNGHPLISSATSSSNASAYHQTF